MSFFRYDNTVNTALGVGLSGVEIFVLTQPANLGVFPPTPLATIYADSSGTPLANPVLSDGLGNYFFYAASGTYTLYIFDPQGRMDPQTFLDQTVVSPGAGTVTSVALTVPVGFAASGSPVTTAGTLGLGYSSDWNANTFIAGPTGGGAGPPTRRTLVAADLPAGVGSVTSVALTVTASALFTSSVSGSPIVSAGTLGITLGLAQQPANTFLGGPASGGTGPVTARALVAADIFLRSVVAFSATPVFNAALAASPTFDMTLTGNVTSSSVTNPVDGQVIRFIIRQDGSGGHPFAWPADFKGASPISADANTSSVQEFGYESSNTAWRAIGPGMVSAT